LHLKTQYGDMTILVLNGSKGKNNREDKGLVGVKTKLNIHQTI